MDGGNFLNSIFINCTNECGVGGLTWVVGDSMDGKIYVSLAVDLVVTDDGGFTFTNITQSTGMIVIDIHNIAIHPTNFDILYIPLSVGIAKTENGGEFWFLTNDGILNTSINLLTTDPFLPNRVYASSNRGEGMYRTDDYGESWLRLNEGGIEMDYGDEIVVDPLDPNHVWYIAEVPVIHESWDRGNTWKVLHNPYIPGDFNFCSVYAIAQSKDNSQMYASNNGFGIFKSFDGGKSWRESNVGWTIDGVFCLVAHPANPEIIYTGTYNGMNRSLDFGEHWEIWDNGWLAEQWVFSIDFDPTNPDIMYACSKNGEDEGRGRDGFRETVMKSIDGGANWFPITNGLTEHWN